MRKLAVLGGLFLILGGEAVRAVEVFSTNSVWRFRKGESEASSPATAWRGLGFDDAAAGFVAAGAPFWYGDGRSGGTQLTDMQTRYSCIFLRRAFTIGNAAQVSSLRLRAYVDDGFVAWINGVEVARVNVPASFNYQTLATNQAVDPAVFNTYTLPAPAGYLASGSNLLAVQVFNTGLNSSDFGFDTLLDVTITETTPPVIANITPPPGMVSALTAIAVTFSEPVTGLSANDFLINGVPAAGMTASGNTYNFTFTQPVFGPVNITWISGHGIADLATPPNAFNASAPGAIWQYDLVDGIAPVMATVHPPAGLTVRTLNQIEVTFSEPVQGVDAADLMINSQPATNVTFVGGAYVFSFTPPPAGLVNVSWAAGHGITDVATTPNTFGGGQWSYAFDPAAPLPNVVINEFLAANVRTNGLKDEDGELQEWIEIRNRGTNSVQLGGWSLSDDPDLPGLWTFPPRTLAPNAYLVVFASGKDRRSTNPASPLHTNFKLSDSGEHLGLYTPDAPRALMHGFSPYPEQRNDISYGYDPGDNERYFATVTPGAANGISTVLGVCAPVHVNVNRGHFATPFDLTASCATPGAVLRYTTNGAEPTSNSPLLPASLRIANTTLFRVAAFKSNHLPSRTVTHSYFFNLPASLRSLPVISIVTATNNLYGPSGILGIQGGTYTGDGWSPVSPGDYHNPSKHGLAWERPTSVEWIRPEDHSGFQVDCGIRVQGSDWQRPRLTPDSKFSFRLYFRSDYGPGRLEYPLFPLTPVQRFDQLVLRAGFNEQGNPFIRDELHRRLSGDMGGIAAHGILAVVFVNGVHYASSPWYNPTERVHEEFFQEHLGGSEAWDVVGPSFAQSASLPGVIDGDRVDFQNLVNYVNSQTVTIQSVYSNIARRLDLTNFADYCLLNAYAAMGDWPGNNWRAGRDRAGGPWRFVVWDAEWGMGIYGRSININSFTESGPGPNDSGLASVSSSEIAQLYNRLRASPEFRLLWTDRVHKHFFNGGALMSGSISNRINEMRADLSALMPNMDPALLVWARDRQAIFFNQLQAQGLIASSNAPVFSVSGGRVPVGFPLAMSNLSGIIYFTTDGSDPRVAFSGAVAASAQTYTNPVSLSQTVTIRARSRVGVSWSALTEATFTAGSLGIPLRISEIMYNPPGGSLHEFIELQNPSGAAIDLSGVYFDGIGFMFDQGQSLPAGGRIVLGANTDTNAWKARYPGVNPIGWFSGNLNNAGERIILLDRFGGIITTVDYSDTDGWPAAADGAGHSLEVINVNGDPDDPANWLASGQLHGSPGGVNATPLASTIRINEIMADNAAAVNHAGTFPDWIELHNSGVSPVNLAGWSLTDDGNARKFVFPDTTIPALGFLTVWCDATTNSTPGWHTGFSLDRKGERIFLYDAATNRVDAISFGLQVTDSSLGRIGGGWTLTVPTVNAANVEAGQAAASHLKINEWLANPAAGEPDWIELYNASAVSSVSLQGIYLATSNQWHRLAAPAYLAPLAHIQLYADEGVGPDHLDFKLPASGGSITLSDASGGLIQQTSYPAQTEGVSRGRLPDGSENIVNFPGSMSPGATNYVVAYNGPRLNEVLARNQSVMVGGRVVDFVELHNPLPGSFNLAGMSVSVGTAKPGKWVFPPNTSLAANAYLVMPCDGNSPVSTNVGNFNLGESLSGEGGGVYLFNVTGQLVQSVEYGPQVEDLSIGYFGGQWRLQSAATPGFANAATAVLGGNSALRLNEWMANPASEDDWFELYNTTNRPVDLSTIAISDDPSLVGQGRFRPAPLSFIGANGFVKWVAAADAGRGNDHVNFALNAAGDALLLYGVNGTNYTLIDALGFGAQAQGISNGRLLDGQANIFAFPGAASPGASNYRILQSVVINEALAHTDPPLEDAIELHNPTAAPVSIHGWYLSNSRERLWKYQITNTVPIAPGGFAVFYEYQFNQGTTNAFNLKAAYDEEIWLTAMTGGVETGERAMVQFGASSNGVSLGRVITSQGVDFWPLTQRSFGVDNGEPLNQFRTGVGRSNAAPLVGPIIISELLYHPAGGTNGSEEFIELQNNTDGVVPLYDPEFPTNRWRLGGGVEFTFPPGLSLAAGTRLLVVDFDPANAPVLAAFRDRYGLADSVPVLGPFGGALANDTDSVELYRPDPPQPPAAPDAGFVPYVVADRVSYTDRVPWPVGAVDGGGHSLQRMAPNLYGNEPLNWVAAAPTPGGENLSVAPDTDGDGIPDWVEDLMGLNRTDPADAALDLDGDGLTNFQEFLAGTDHVDASSSLKLEVVTTGAGFTLLFKAVVNRSYSVLYTTSLEYPEWSKLVDIPAAPQTEDVEIAVATEGHGMHFYQLVTPAIVP